MSVTSALSRPHTADLEHLQEVLRPIRELSAVWDIPLASYLADFLDSIARIEIGEEFDPAALSFSQAGLFLQGSTNVYAKKVRALYEMAIGSAAAGDGADSDGAKRRQRPVEWTANGALAAIEDPRAGDGAQAAEGRGAEAVTTLPKVPFALVDSLDGAYGAVGKFRVNIVPDERFAVVLLDAEADLDALGAAEADEESIQTVDVEEGAKGVVSAKGAEEEESYEECAPPPPVAEGELGAEEGDGGAVESGGATGGLPEMLNPDSNELSFTIRPFQQFRKMPVPTSFDDRKKKGSLVKKPFHEDLFGEIFDIVKEYRKKRMEEEDRESIAIVVPEETGREHVLDDLDAFVEMPPPLVDDEGDYVELPQNDGLSELSPNEVGNGKGAYEQMCKNFIVNMIRMGQSQVMLTEESKTLTKWENKLLPILEIERQRKAFNIEDVDNWIIDVIEAHDDKYSFKALTEELDQYERSRVFMGLLILVNTHKVALENYTPGLENDDFNICLLKN